MSPSPPSSLVQHLLSKIFNSFFFVFVQQTPMHVAACFGFPEVIQFLFENGAAVDNSDVCFLFDGKNGELNGVRERGMKGDSRFYFFDKKFIFPC